MMRKKRIILCKDIKFKIQSKVIESTLIRLNRSTPGCFRQLCSLHHNAFRFLGRYQYIINRSEEQAYLRYLLRADRSSFYGLYHNNELIASICLACTKPFVGSIELLAIHPKYQHRGIGSQLMRFAKQWARSRHYTRLEVGTYDKLHAIPFYIMHKFKKVYHETDREYSFTDLVYRIRY